VNPEITSLIVDRMWSGAFSRKALLEDYEMGYWVGSIVSNIFSILVGSIFAGLIFRKLAPKYAESLGYATKTVSIIAVVIALNLWIMTLGPSSLTVDAVGLQLIAGVLIAGGKIFARTRRVGIYECEECGPGHDLYKKSDQPLREGNRFSCTNCGAEISGGSFFAATTPLLLVNIGLLVGLFLNENWGIVLLLSGVILGFYTAGRDKREA